MIKEKENFTSDRQLGKAIGVANMTDYRLKGVLPKENTCLKIASLANMKPELIFVLSAAEKAKRQNKETVYEVWKKLYEDIDK